MSRITDLAFPKSFPNAPERAFLKLVLASEADFLPRYEEWKQVVVFDQLDYATSKLLPLLYRRLRDRNINDAVVGRIQGIYKLAWVKNQRLLDALAKIVTPLEQAGIDVLILKGVPLLLDVYKDVGARFLGDADILIDPKHAHAAIRVLRAAGWKFINPRFPLYEKFSEIQLVRMIKEAGVENGNGIEIDVHWRLFELSAQGLDLLPYSDLFARSRIMDFKNKTYRAISPEDMLLHVIVHGAEGNVHRTLRWVTDTVGIINAYKIDWKQFMTLVRASEWHIDVVMAFSFLLEHELVIVSDAVPEWVITELKDMATTLTAQNSPAINAYYQKANTPHAWWGGFPRIWRSYWNFTPRPAMNFITYLTYSWGFEHTWQLVPFILRKYLERFKHLFLGK